MEPRQPTILAVAPAIWNILAQGQAEPTLPKKP